MITSYLLNGKFKEQKHNDFCDIRESINVHRKKLWDLELDVIIELLHELGKKLILDKNILTLPGISYLSLWIKKDNLRRICSLNYLDESYYENFKPTEGNVELCIQPRGVVCHWIADNVPTLAFFSIIQAILSKNGSIVKVSDVNKETILYILKILSDIKIKVKGKTYLGHDILQSISIISFNSKKGELNKAFSLSADCKIIWGGSDAVQSIISLPQREHCETIAFGPKYSFGVFDKQYIESAHFKKTLSNAVQDVVIFNQMACSSPHVFFFEKSSYSIKEIAHMMKTAFENLPDKFLKQEIPQGIVANIINERGRYLLDDGKDILKSEDLSWTILINETICLEDPIQGRCIFIKEVDTIESVLDLITRKIQAISTSILDKGRLKEFARQATYRGVDRIMPPGKIHNFDLPWDGILALNRLVRWVILKNK